MPTSVLGKQRNLTLECCKLLASCFVVFIHVPFPWPVGEFVLCLARFAVPMFFAISGWYSYRVPADKLLKRMGHMLLLELAGIAIMQVWGVAATVYIGADVWQSLLNAVPGRQALWRWLIFQDDPYGGQLWYLSASAFVYGVFWLYNRLTQNRWGYRPAYFVGACLLLGHFLMGELSVFTGLEIYSRNYRSGLFMGLPLFLMGLFLREYREKLLEMFRMPQLMTLMLLGMGISVAEWRCFGKQELYFGLLLEVPALLLAVSCYPRVPRWLDGMARISGSVSTGIYLVHFAVLDIYLAFFQWRIEYCCGGMEPWLQPFAVLAISAAGAVLWMIPEAFWKRLRKK